LDTDDSSQTPEQPAATALYVSLLPYVIHKDCASGERDIAHLVSVATTEAAWVFIPVDEAWHNLTAEVAEKPATEKEAGYHRVRSRPFPQGTYDAAIKYHIHPQYFEEERRQVNRRLAEAVRQSRGSSSQNWPRLLRASEVMAAFDAGLPSPMDIQAGVARVLLHSSCAIESRIGTPYGMVRISITKEGASLPDTAELYDRTYHGLRRDSAAVFLDRSPTEMLEYVLERVNGVMGTRLQLYLDQSLRSKTGSER